MTDKETEDGNPPATKEELTDKETEDENPPAIEEEMTDKETETEDENPPTTEEEMTDNETEDGNPPAIDEEMIEREIEDGNPPATEKQRLLESETRIRQLKLYRAALNGNWQMAESIFKKYEEDIRVGISAFGDTVLHIATRARDIDFVKELVKNMNDQDLVLRNVFGQTALSIAAWSGKVDLAKELMKNNKEIAVVRDKFGTLPIQMAALLGHKDMLDYLYQETKHDLKVEDRNDLFVSVIETDLYEFAFKLLKDYPDLATARARARVLARARGLYDEELGATALHVLARKHPTSSNRNQRGIFERCFNLRGKYVEKKNQQALELVKVIWKRVILLSRTEIEKLITKPRDLISDAAARGNIEFLSILIHEYPDLMFKLDNLENCYSIFHVAVRNRQKEVFNLIHEIGATKDLILTTEDGNHNNILHLAGMMPPTDVLNIVPGPVLQMQSELLWFQEVETVVQPWFVEARNDTWLTPKELFIKEHEDLRKKGEKWMKAIAGSCMVVATLITGVAFAVAITVPGGNNGDTGFPFFIEKVSFKILAISDAISLVSSSASILNFLSIFTSSCDEEDFLWWLPRKLRLALATLFISIATMMIVFSTIFFLFFNDTRLWIAILVTAIASIPVIIFIRQHFRLFYDVLRSTHVSYSPFQKGKSSLFQEEEEASNLFQEEEAGCDQRQDVHLKSQYPCSINV